MKSNYSWIVLSRPGTKYGPCWSQFCSHPNCNRIRCLASQICPLCKEGLGYQSRLAEFSCEDFPSVKLCHLSCIEAREVTSGKMIASGSSTSPSAALSNQTVNLFSDLLVHHMGRDLADGITQGSAGPDEFRTAPLWGVGQRFFFLHDGRTSDLVEAVETHKSRDSEANKVIEHFNKLHAREQQDIINFLRSL